MLSAPNLLLLIYNNPRNLLLVYWPYQKGLTAEIFFYLFNYLNDSPPFFLLTFKPYSSVKVNLSVTLFLLQSSITKYKENSSRKKSKITQERK